MSQVERKVNDFSKCALSHCADETYVNGFVIELRQLSWFTS